MNEQDLIALAEDRRMAAINLAERDYNFQMALIATFSGSALDVLANLGKENANMMGAEAQLPESFKDVCDLGQLGGMLGVNIAQGLRVTIESIPEVGDLTMMELGLNNIESSHVTGIGAEIMQAHGNLREELGTGGIVRVYTRYKGGPLYRYTPYGYTTWVDLVNIARAMSQGHLVNVTVGEFIERVIKKRHEMGHAMCEKLEGHPYNTWVTVLNKKQKAAQKEGAAAAQRMTEAAETHQEVNAPPAAVEEMVEAAAQENEQVAEAEGRADTDPTDTGQTTEQASGTETEASGFKYEAPADVVPTEATEPAPVVPASETPTPAEIPAPEVGTPVTESIPTPTMQAGEGQDEMPVF